MRNRTRIPGLRIGLQQVAAGIIAGRRCVFVSTISGMQITFDPDKDRANQAKHGLSLSLAERMDWGGLLAKPDSRREYGELRVIGFVPDATGRVWHAPHHQPAQGEFERGQALCSKRSKLGVAAP